MQELIRCFLIDDDNDDQEIFSMAVRELGRPIECVFANDGVQAIEMLNDGLAPQFIFLDMNMPRMNGPQCLEAIRKIERLSHVPVYMFSTFADIRSVSETKALGAVDFIVKPNSIGALTDRLLRLFEVSHQIH